MPELGHLDLDLLFERSGSGFGVRVVRSPAGDGQSALFELPVSGVELENFALKIGRPRIRTRRQEAAPVKAAKDLGGRLFDAVFTGTVGECLRRSADVAGTAGVPLRIRLRLSDSPELADLPWELLYDSGDKSFLALSGTTPVVRYVHLPVQPRAVPVTLPLRVLLVRSEPDGCPQLDLETEWQQVAAELEDLTGAGALAVTELATPTLRELRRALSRDTFHVLHYMGHGAFDEQDGGTLLFADAAGRAAPVTGESLGVMLRDHSSLRLAILNACEAARIDPADPLAGVAETLVHRGIPAVIAMQFEISDQAAIEFAPALYGALAAGRPIDTALAEARKAIYTVSPIEWATPVLYLRADDAHLFDIVSAPPPATTSTPVPIYPSDKDTGSGIPKTAASTADALVEEGDRLVRQRRYAEAETVYRVAVLTQADLAPAHSGLGRALAGLNRLTEAEAACREAIRLSPASQAAHDALGLVLLNLGRYTEAEAVCREAIRLNPASRLAFGTLGNALQSLGHSRDAEAACRHAIRLDPADAWTHNNLAIMLSAAKRFDEAEAEYREAIRLDPDIGIFHYNFGITLSDMKRVAEAEAEYREAIRLDPTHAWPHNNLALLLSETKRFDEAEAEYREGIRLDSTHTKAYENLVELLQKQGRKREAKAVEDMAAKAGVSLG